MLCVRIDPPPVTGIVLAGGESRRMGRDKARLQWQGRSLLEHMWTLLLDAGCGQCVVSGARPGFFHVPDRRPRLGPLGGLESVVTACPNLRGHLLVVAPVDMPLLAPRDVRRLWETALSQHFAAASFVGYPLPAVMYNDAHLPSALARGIAGSGSIKELLTELGSAELPLPDGRMRFSNANTPGQWHELAGVRQEAEKP